MNADHDALIERVRSRLESEENRPELPATDADMLATERSLDAPLPPLLRRLFVEVANGGFGPYGGVLGAAGGFRHEDLGTLDEAYRSFRSDGTWPRGVAPIIDFGCTQWICLATAENAGTLAVKDDQNQLWRTEFTIEWMFDAWCRDRDVWNDMHEEVGLIEREIINPFTKQRQTLRKPKRGVRGAPWPGYSR